MVDCNLYDSPVSFPKIEAVNNGKLEITRTNELEVTIHSTVYSIVGVRGATTDPWEIDIVKFREQDHQLVFSGGDQTINPDTLGWKSMADLALKEHQRPTDALLWKPGNRLYGGPLIKADNAKVNGYTEVTSVTELGNAFQAKVSEAGDITLIYNPSTNVLIGARDILITQIKKCVAAILADTTNVTRTENTTGIVENVSYSPGIEFRTAITLLKASGTEDISVGNYSRGKATWRVDIPAYGANALVHNLKELDEGGVYAVPSIVLDQMRKAAKAGSYPRISLAQNIDNGGLSVIWDFGKAVNATADDTAYAWISASDPNGYAEFDFDQANSMNVLATAAFASLGGAVAVGSQYELENILANSGLTPAFAQIANALGVTTATLISGYVASLVSAYAQGWISSEQLFSLENHAAWITAGAKYLLGAAAVSSGTTLAANLLGGLGVNNIAQAAIVAAGGVGSVAGITLGMAAVMAKVVKHIYWGA